MWVLYLQDAPVVKPAAVDLPVVCQKEKDSAEYKMYIDV